MNRSTPSKTRILEKRVVMLAGLGLLLLGGVAWAQPVSVDECNVQVSGLDPILDPGTVILLGELHGTNESPRFLTDATCRALATGHSVTVGLELPQRENNRVQAYLRSEGDEAAKDSLLAGPFWQRAYQDGRSSYAMLAAIDRLRAYQADERELRVILIDDTAFANRDSVMAAAVLDAFENRPDDVFVILTGNIHNRVTVGTPWDAEYEPAGYLLRRARPDVDVISLDVAYRPGQAWVCFPDGSCAARSLNGRGETDSGVTMYPGTADLPYDGQYFVGALTASLPAIRLTEEADFASFFADAGVEGTFVLYDPSNDRYLAHNPERAARRFIPASTFKIPNSLIALETGAVGDTSTMLTWDGQVRSISAWNRDHSMSTAFRYSVVWYYQELARRVGEHRMDSLLTSIDYGNNDVGGGVDRFWLTGRLRISALEQIEFLKRLAEGDLPFSERSMDAVRGIMAEDHGDNYTLRGKTGWAGSEQTDIGWFVGYLERENKRFFFALNMDIEDDRQATHRREITRAILAARGLIPSL